MPSFSKTSLERLATCAPLLVTLFSEVIKHRDCTIACGHRGEAEQNAAYAAGASREQWPNGKHNSTPSNAVDVYPFINGAMSTDPNECRVFAGFVLGIAAICMPGRIRWGGDWDGDHDDHTRQGFNDLVHFELIPEATA